MNALVNSCAMVWSGDGSIPDGPRARAGPQGPLWWTTERPGSLFADTPALLDRKEQDESDKNEDDRMAASAAREREQAALEARRRDRRLSSEIGQVTAATGLAGPTGTPVRLEGGNVPNAGSASIVSSGDVPLAAQESMGSAAHHNLLGSECRPAGRTLFPKGLSASEGAGSQDAMPSQGDPRGARANTVPAGTPLDSPAQERGRLRKASAGGDGPAATTARLRVLSKAHAWAVVQPSGPALSKTPLSGPSTAARQGTSGLGDGPRLVPSRFPSVGPTIPKAEGFAAATRPRGNALSPGVKEMQPAQAPEDRGQKTEDRRQRTAPSSVLRLPSSEIRPPSSVLRPPKSGAAESPVRDVAEQILDSLRASVMQGNRQIVIRLQPPELGTVIVRLREQDRHLDGRLEVGESDTRLEIERALPEVVRSLQEAGIPIRRFEVMTDNRPEQDIGRGLSQQDGGAGQQNLDQGRDSLSVSWASHSLGDGDCATASDPAQSKERWGSGSEGGIDVLL
jgi:hypothetical protein